VIKLVMGLIATVAAIVRGPLVFPRIDRTKRSKRK
jgi:hypothetical protein